MNDGGKLLIADDDDLFSQTTAAVLEREGHVCTRVANGAAVLEEMEIQQFDLLIADIKMPGNRELELVQRVQQKTSDLAIVLVTGHPSFETAHRAIQLKAAAYFVKPFDIHRFVDEVRVLTGRVKRQRMLLGFQERWREWGEELLTAASVLHPSVLTANQTGETMLELSLRNLSRCVADVQELRQAFCGDAQPPHAVPDSPQVEAQFANVLVAAEEKVVASHRSFREKMSRAILPAELQARLQQLSRREREVLRLLLANQKPQIIARTLFISLHTVRNHLRSIFEKLSVHSQTELLTRLGQYVTYSDLQEAVS